MLTSVSRARAPGAARLIRLAILAVLVWLASAKENVGAQTAPAMTSFRHKNSGKELPTLNWVGSYGQPTQYARWWRETATCARIPLPENRLDSVTFFYVNAKDFAPLPTDKPNRMVAAVTYGSREQIYVSAFLIRDEVAIKHEMMHQVLFWWGEPNWDADTRPEFRRCGLELRASITR